MDNKELVSIGMPVHNGAAYLRQALETLLAQDYEKFELLISDNASTDATGEICREYAARDRRIQYQRLETKVEVFTNFDLVLQRANGYYFMWAAADDRWLPQFITELRARLAAEEDSRLAMCATKRVREDGTLVDTIHMNDLVGPDGKIGFYGLAMALASGKPYHISFYGLHRTEFIRRAYVRLPMVVLGDRLFICELALATRFSFIDKVLYIRMGHEQPMPERYAGEVLGQVWSDRMKYCKLIARVLPQLFGSAVIPWSRKLFIPAIAFRFAWVQKKRVRRELWNELRLQSQRAAWQWWKRIPRSDGRA
jgi:glycosyltransferase involved in cell wall biosynthesis